MTIDEMKQSIINYYGFEHPATLYFFGECERTDDMAILEIAFEFAQDWPIEDEDW